MLGSLGLLRQLSALGRAGRKQTPAERMASRKFIQRNLKRLDSGAQQFFLNLKAREDSKVREAQAERQAQIAMFFAQYLPEPVNYRKEHAVVSAFIMGSPASHAGLQTDGVTLTVNGREIAKRDSSFSKFLKVCPGEFGADAAGRRAANAALDILGAGLRVDDRESKDPDARGGYAFIHPKGHGGRVVSDKACYTVEVNRRIRAAAARALSPMSGEPGAANLFYGPKPQAAEVKAELFPGEQKLTKAEKKEVSAELRARLAAYKKAKAAAEKQKKAEEKARKAALKIMPEAVSEQAGDLMGLGRMHRRHRR